MRRLLTFVLMWFCSSTLQANDMYWLEPDGNAEGANAETPSSPPREFFSLNTIYLRNKLIVHVGHDLINQSYVMMPSPNIMRIEKLPNERRRVTIQQYFPDAHEKIMSNFNIGANKLQYLYIKTYDIYDQDGNLVESIKIPPGIQYRPPQFYNFEVAKSVKMLSFVFGFTGRTAWAQSGMSSDLQGLYRDLRDLGVDRDSELKIDINPGTGLKAAEVLTSQENRKIGQILSDFQHIVAWGRMAQKEDLISKITDLKNFETVHIDLAKGVEDLKKYPHIFGDPLNPKYQNLIKKMSSEKLTEKEHSSEHTSSAKLGIGKLFSGEGGNTTKKTSRFKEMIKFDIEGDMYVPKSLDFVIRTNDSFDMIKTLVFQAYDQLEEANFRLGTGVSLSPVEETPEFATKSNAISTANGDRAQIDYKCPANTIMAGSKSAKLGLFDRSYQHECREITHYQNAIQRKNCQMSNPLNGQAQNFTFQCADNSFLSGEKSNALNGDRAFSYECCSLASDDLAIKKKECKWSGWLNGAGAAFEYFCPANTALAGVQTEYLAAQFGPVFHPIIVLRKWRTNLAALGDRRFNYLCCAYGSDL